MYANVFGDLVVVLKCLSLVVIFDSRNHVFTEFVRQPEVRLSLLQIPYLLDVQWIRNGEPLFVSPPGFPDWLIFGNFFIVFGGIRFWNGSLQSML